MTKDAIPAPDDMLEAERELEAALVTIFSQVTVAPVISEIRSVERSADWSVLTVTCESATDGCDIVWRFEVGKPVTPEFF